VNLIPLVLLLVAVAVASQFVQPLGGLGAQYIAVACLAGMDTICGGVRSGLEGKFHNDVFITGFISNVLIAFFISWLGDQIGINLFLAAALVLGSRIYTNLSLIRRFALTKWQDSRERARMQKQGQGQSQG